MISTGIIGTARHGTTPNSASRMRVNTLDRSAPPCGEDRAAGALHVRGFGRIADHLQREIRLDARADVQRAVGEQRPAAVIALDTAQIARDLLFEFEIGRFAEVMHEQHVFGGNRGVGFEFVEPVAVGVLRGEQRVGGLRDRRIDLGERGGRNRPVEARQGSVVHHCSIDGFISMSAAFWPERIAPSIVAGRPVAVQSPASMRLGQRVRVAGRRLSWLGMRGERRALLDDDLPRRHRLGRDAGHAWATSRPERAREFFVRHVEQARRRR